MTVESRPPFTKEMEIFAENVYEKARRDRLSECIGEYLSDESCDSRRAYEEILEEVKSWADYHKKNLDKVNDLHQLLLGFRPVDLDSSTSDG